MTKIYVCPKCAEEVFPDEITVCGYCSARLGEEGLSETEQKLVHCQHNEDKGGHLQCGYVCCVDCGKTCDECSRQFCSEHAFKCLECDHKTCWACTERVCLAIRKAHCKTQNRDCICKNYTIWKSATLYCKDCVGKADPKVLPCNAKKQKN